MRPKRIDKHSLSGIAPALTLILCAVLILISGLSVNGFAAEPIKIVYFKDYPPLSWQQNNKMQGILIDIMNEALKKRMHIDISHQGRLWEEAQLMVKNGQADAFVTVPTPERRAYTRISRESVINSSIKIFTGRNNPRIEDLAKVHSYSELKPFKLVDYRGNGRAAAALKGLDVDWLATMDEIPEYLIKGKADAWTQNIFVAEFFLRSIGDRDKIIELPNVLAGESFNLCVGKNSAFVRILDLFDQTIKDMKKDGTLEKICTAYR